MKNSKLFIALLVITSVMVGCNKKDDSNDGVRVRSSGGRNYNDGYYNGNNGYNSGNYGGWSGAVGEVQGSGNFQSAIINLLAPPMDENEIGEVDSYGGLQFQGLIRFDQSGNLNTHESGIVIKVTDSFELSGQDPIDTISIPGTGGRVNRSNGQTDVTFEDGYGRLVMRGVYNSRDFQGEMSYQNKVTGRNMLLGTFRIETCGFFVCQ